LLKLPSDPAGKRILLGVALMALLVGGLFAYDRSQSPDEAEAKPALMLMSSIPLQWGEANISDIANGKADPSPLFDHLSRQNKLVLIDDFQKVGKPGAAPMLLIQPRALAPRELVELDSWIRKGGTAIIFADPALDWPSDLPLGDQRRPLFTSLLTPMFRHWGLELALPVDENAKDDPVAVGEYRLAPKSAGIWLKAGGKPSAGCTIRPDQLIAYCRVEKGRALLISDADVLNEERWTDSLITSGTMAWLEAVVTASRKPDSLPANLWENEGS
jgi:hypothetical protein